jgi:aminoglycoside phosphotransferase (APT) family kinase protein
VGHAAIIYLASVPSAARASPRPVRRYGAAVPIDRLVPGSGDQDAPGLDLSLLMPWLDRARPGLRRGVLRGALLAGGRSNLTYALDDDVHRWVLRRPPLGHVLATAHDMSREFRVISALHRHETTGRGGIPVPEPVVLCEDDSPLGVPFYLMERVDGVVLRTRADLLRVPEAERPGLGDRLVDTLAALHAVDPDVAGLAGFGRPDGFTSRQLVRWSHQLEASRSREVAGIDDLRDRLVADVPVAQRATVVHGDFRLDNVLVRPDDWQLAAVLDWEMAALGDPMTDLGLMLVYWGNGSGADGALRAVADTPSSVPGFATGQELAARYADATGLALDRLPWYVAFGYFKLAVILEGIHYRFAHGQTIGSGFERIGAVVPGLVAAGHDALTG